MIYRTVVKHVNWDLYLVPWEWNVFFKTLNLDFHGIKHTMLAVWKHNLPPLYQLLSLPLQLQLVRKRK